MTRRDDVLLVTDAPDLILGRLAKAWHAQWTARSHRIHYSMLEHRYRAVREADSSRLVFWVDQLAFRVAPRAAFVPQVVMTHHLTAPEVAPTLAALRNADAIATASCRWQRGLRELTGRDVWLIPYTLDTTLFVPRPDARVLRQSMGISDGEFVVGFAARALANAFGRKGIDLFLDVVAAAARRWSDLTVLLVGSGWEALVPRIEAFGCRVIYRIPAAADETREIYPAMNVFLCTSNEEGGPCTILEAMACEVPVITTDVGHVPEVVSDGVTGFVARERTPAPFLDAMAALRGGGDLVARIAAEGRKLVEAKRDHARVLPGIPYLAIYEEAERTFSRRGTIRPRRAFERTFLAARYAARTIRNRARR